MISLLKRTELEFLLIDYGLEELVKIKQNLIFGKRKLLLVQNSEYGLAINQNELKNLLKKYREELTLHLDKIKKIKKVLNSHNITLLYAAKDTKNNQAIILKDFIENIKSGA